MIYCGINDATYARWLSPTEQLDIAVREAQRPDAGPEEYENLRAAIIRHREWLKGYRRHNAWYRRLWRWVLKRIGVTAIHRFQRGWYIFTRTAVYCILFPVAFVLAVVDLFRNGPGGIGDER